MNDNIQDRFKSASGAKFDIPALYDYFYEERSMELFGDFSKEEFIEYLKLHT